MPVPKILVVSPPPFGTPQGASAPKFQGAAEKSAGLAEALAIVARERGCAFADAGEFVASSAIDGVHLDAEQHVALGRALAPVIGSLLTDVNT